MPDDPRVERLIEEMLDSGSSAEEVCRDTPELLHRVREGWRRFRALEARIDELFPEPGSGGDDGSVLPEDDLPRVPGYELIRVVGHGGVGVVYKAVHLRLNRTVALKMPLAGAFATRAERQRFAREAEMVARLRHPNVVQVYDVGDLDGRPYFTMEFVEGGNLADLIAGTPRPAREAAALVATLADAIAAAHQSGVMHRDLKPSNVLLSADGTPKVTDFGLARRLEVGSSLTHTGAAVGTPSYMAPEQAQGRTGEVGPAADIYALGAVLYELLTGRPPFRAESAAETVHQVITQDPVAPSRLNAKVPRDLETICLKCLHKERLLRYATAAALRDDLRCFLRGEAIAARPEGRLRRLARRIRRRPARAASVAAGTLLALTMMGGSLWLILDRAETAHKVAGERAAMEAAADEDLREMERLQEASSWPEAAAALERAKGRLGQHGGPAVLRRRLEQGARELGLVASLDAIRLRRATAHEQEELAAARLDRGLRGGPGPGRARPIRRGPGSVRGEAERNEDPDRPRGHLRPLGLQHARGPSPGLAAVGGPPRRPGPDGVARPRPRPDELPGQVRCRGVDRGRPGRRSVRALVPGAREESECRRGRPGTLLEEGSAGAPRRPLRQSRPGRESPREGSRRGGPLLPGGAGHPAGCGRHPQQPRRGARADRAARGGRRPVSHGGAIRPEGP